MLTAIQLQQRRRPRQVPSLKQQYHEYILQRIEGYKNSLSRRELLDLGNEAVAEMELARSGQFLLTEVLLTDWVDRLIHKRLGLQPFSRWQKHFKQLRSAQREPTRWGIEPRCPVIGLLPRLEPGDAALVIGTDVAPIAYLLASHDVAVTFLGSDLTFVDQVESRLAEEALGHYCATYVTPTGQLPLEVPEQVQLVVFDTGTLDTETQSVRRAILERLMARTAPGGAHLVMPSSHALSPEAYLSLYPDWSREDQRGVRRKPARSAGILLGKPPEEPASSHPISSHDVSA
jgi:hypothetical protein